MPNPEVYYLRDGTPLDEAVARLHTDPDYADYVARMASLGYDLLAEAAPLPTPPPFDADSDDPEERAAAARLADAERRYEHRVNTPPAESVGIGRHGPARRPDNVADLFAQAMREGLARDTGDAYR